MEKKNSDSKRKSPMKSNEEPPDKKVCHGVSIQDILPPSEERNQNLSAHSIQHVIGSSGSSNVDISQDNNDNIPTTSDRATSTSSTENNPKSSEIPSNSDRNDPVDESITSTPSPIPPCSSVDEVTNHTSVDTLITNESQSKDEKTDGKKIKWKCERHFSDHGTHSVDTDTFNIPIPNTGDPQTSRNSFTMFRNRCAYGPKCFRKNSEHKAKFSHPGDSDYDIEDNRPECRYGIKCYRTDPKHKRDFKHTVIRRKRAQTPVRVWPHTYKYVTDQSSAEESVDESEYDPSTDEYDSSALESTKDYEDCNGDW